MRGVVVKTLWRYARQVQVLGADAQRALLEGSAEVLAPEAPREAAHRPSDGGASLEPLGALVEALYLAGAGVGTLAVPCDGVADAVRAFNPGVRVTRSERALAPAHVGSAPLPPLRDPTAQCVAEASARALATIARLTAAARSRQARQARQDES